MARKKPNAESVDEGVPTLFSGWVALDQGFQLMLVITPSEVLRWHPDSDATVFYDDGSSEAVTVKRTTRPKTVKPETEIYISAERDGDPEVARDIRYLALTNRGVEVQVWEEDAFKKRSKR